MKLNASSKECSIVYIICWLGRYRKTCHVSLDMFRNSMLWAWVLDKKLEISKAPSNLRVLLVLR